MAHSNLYSWFSFNFCLSNIENSSSLSGGCQLKRFSWGRASLLLICFFFIEEIQRPRVVGIRKVCVPKNYSSLFAIISKEESRMVGETNCSWHFLSSLIHVIKASDLTNSFLVEFLNFTLTTMVAVSGFEESLFWEWTITLVHCNIFFAFYKNSSFV